MNNIIKVVKLDILLINRYITNIIYTCIITSLLTISSKSLIASAIATMTLLAIRATTLIFQSEEKENFLNFYTFAPIKKSNLVIGRYLFLILFGLGICVISLLIQTGILKCMGISINIFNYLTAFVLGSSIYIISISLQIPGIYKYGYINGSLYTYIPLLIYLIINYLTGSLNIINIRTVSFILNNQLLVYKILSIFSIILISISLTISIKIKKK